MTTQLSESVIQYAQGQLGFNRVSILPVAAAETFPAFTDWLQHGYQADMAWLETNERKEKRADIRNIMPSAQSVITLVYTYRTDDLPVEILRDPSRGIFARYTWGRDYHRVLKRKLEVLITYIENQLGETIQAKAYVDTGPILEREVATRAGLGFIGNNSMLINPKFGSYIFISEILVDQVLAPVTYKSVGGCRTCTNCVKECPTKAIVENKVVDARRCISYLTIENRGSIPLALRPLMHNRIYGCDICQEVCPWNEMAQAKQTQNDWLEAALQRQAPPLVELAQLDEAAFLERFKGTPIMRTKRRGLLRNVAVALGNWGSDEAEGALKQLSKDTDPIIQEHALWGLQQIGRMSIL